MLSEKASAEFSDFGSDGRFVVERRLGAGGMGVVYQAFDKERGERVALKTLTRVDPAGIYRLKQEFRALADVTHPNLVCLHELVSDGDEWFFTMELVEGTDFFEYVRDPSEFPHSTSMSRPIHPPTTPDIPPTLGQGALPDNTLVTPSDVLDETPRAASVLGDARPRGEATAVNVARLRAGLAELVRGVNALHDAGKLHRDLKPSNVLVTKTGRVIILDFGLVQDRVRAEQNTAQDPLAGTPAYMAPEQAACEPLTPAADWYGVGAILYVALTGRHPFDGTALQILMAKQMREPPRPSELVDGVPEDLDALCVALLRRSPADRAVGREMALALLTSVADSDATHVRAHADARASRFVGREEQLRALGAALRETKSGHAALVYVHGTSGMGKTAVVQHFLAELRARDEGIVLSGRCYERESVPFKAFDSIVDALSRYLRRLPRAEAFWLLPRGVHELSRVFPSLRRIDAVSDVPPRTFEIPSQSELRRLAFAALKELLSRLVEKRPVILYIDDLQWGDRDSALLLKEILAPPNTPAVLVIGTYRTDEADASPFLRELFAAPANPGGVVAQKVFVGALPQEQAAELALTMLEGRDQTTRARAAAMARESEGNPFFVGELARHSESGRADDAAVTVAAGADVSLERVLAGRIGRLPLDARRLLEIVAVAGGPVPQGVAARASGLGAASRAALTQLRAAQLVRTRGARDADAVESYHDRIRECVASRLDAAALSDRHLSLAQAHEASGQADPELLALHLRGAGQLERAGEFAAQAAARAADALAFDRASALYRQALEWKPGDVANARALKTKLGDALLAAGRGPEAAAAYLDVARTAPPADALELRRRAAEQLLVCGHIDEGLDVLRTVLRAVDIPYPSSSNRALAALLFRRAKLSLRGLKFKERHAREIPKEALARIDICFSVSLGLSVVDTIQAAAFQAQGLLLALDAGEPNRIALALAFEGGYVACAGGSERTRALDLVNAAEALAARLENPQAEGFARLMSGVSDWAVGRWKSGLASLEEAERILRERCTGVTWQLDNSKIFAMICLTSLGDLAELAKRHPVWLKEAEERGDRYAAASLRTFWGAGVLLALAADDPVRARKDVDETMAGWSQRGFHVQHYYALMSRVMVDLYEGQASRAHDRVTSSWAALSGSLLLRVQSLRITALSMRAGAALAAAGQRPADAKSLLKLAEKDARELAGEKMPWSDPLAALVRAAIAHKERRGRGAVEDALEAAARGFDAADMALYGAAARRRLGALIPGQRGEDLIARADALMSRHRIKDHARLTATLAPGFD